MPTTTELSKNENTAITRAIAALSAFDSTQQSFVGFTTHLLHDVYKILLDATVEQLEAYADLVANVSGTMADFEVRMVGDAAAFEARALDYINTVVIPSFGLSPPLTGPVTAPGTPATFPFDPTTIETARTAYAGAVAKIGGQDKDFSAALTTSAGAGGATYTMPTADLIALTIAKLKLDVKSSYDKLVTILKIGMQKLVVTDGEVKTALTWHLHANDSDERSASSTTQAFEQSASSWGVSHAATRSLGLSGKLFGLTFGRTRGSVTTAGASGSRGRTELRVQVVNEKKTAVTDLEVDITGSVTIRFKSETFPPVDPTAVAP